MIDLFESKLNKNICHTMEYASTIRIVKLYKTSGLLTMDEMETVMTIASDVAGSIVNPFSGNLSIKFKFKEEEYKENELSATIDNWGPLKNPGQNGEQLFTIHFQIPQLQAQYYTYRYGNISITSRVSIETKLGSSSEIEYKYIGYSDPIINIAIEKPQGTGDMENILKIETRELSEEIQQIQFIFPDNETKQVAITGKQLLEEENGLRRMVLHFTTPMVNHEYQESVTANVRVILLSYESLIFCGFTYINGDLENLNNVNEYDNKSSAGGSSSGGNSAGGTSSRGSSSEGSSSNESSSENSDNQYDCNFGDFLFDNMSRSEIEEIGRKYKSTKDMFGYRLVDHLLIRGCKEWAKVILEATKVTPWGYDILGTSTMEWCAFNGTFEIIKEFFLDESNVNDLDLKTPEFISPYLKEKYQDSHLKPHEESNHSISFSLNENGNERVAIRNWFDDFEDTCLFLKQLTRNHNLIGPRLDSVRITKSYNIYTVEYVENTVIYKTVQPPIISNTFSLIDSTLQQEYLNINEILNSCRSLINGSLLNNKFNIENIEHIKHINSYMSSIKEVVETINSQNYLITLNNLIKLLEEKLEMFDEHYHYLDRYLQNTLNNCKTLLLDHIPFIIEKYQQLQNIVDIMNDYKTLSEQFSTLQRKKARSTRELNKIKLDIDVLKDELKLVTNKNESIEIEEEITEHEKTVQQKKQSLKENIQQINEIKLKFLQLKTIGFEMESILTTNIASSLNIEEMTPDLFKEITPIDGFVGNHHLFIGIDFNDKKHIIKQYIIKDEKMLESLQKELEITMKLKHNNIIEIEGQYMSNDSIYSNSVFIVMPYYLNGNLKEFIEKQRKSSPQILDLLFWERTWRQLLIAIQHIHSRGVIHCDIKPENIFVRECNNNGFYPIILGDFDISLDIKSRTMNLMTRTSISGTFEYLSPELMNGQSATFKSDMFAFGKTIKNCMNDNELSTYSSLNELITQCLNTNSDDRPFASDALVYDFFLKDTLLDEIKIQKKVEFISNQSKQLQDFEKQLIQLKSNLNQEKSNLNQEIKKLEKISSEFTNQSAKEKLEISNEIKRLKKKEMKLQDMAIELEESKSKQLNIVLPSYWKRNTFNSYLKRFYINDVTKHLKSNIQDIINVSCNSSTLGRDQQVRMNYSKLIVSSVSRIENATLFSSFKSRMNQLASYNDSNISTQVQTEQVSKSSKAFEWMKTVGLNSRMNEKYLWYGTKPEFVSTIAEHGFDERISLGSLFGAGIYFAEYCSKSDQYCTPDSNNECTLLLCRVVLGRQIYNTPSGMKNERRPPQINGANRVYDSVIGQSNSSNTSYRDLIVYNRYQCYPEYIIKYKRE